MAIENKTEETEITSNFIHDFIDEDLKDGVYSRVQTRFPPEPNGYLHIGHAKAICINFGVKNKYNGVCNLRLDDTNPVKEDTEYVEAIEEDIKWLGFDWDNVYFASDYFDFIYDCAIKLIKKARLMSMTFRLTKSKNTGVRSPSRAKIRRIATEALKKISTFSLV